jgi:hypothetical protein
MTYFDDEDDDYRARRRSRPEPPRSAQRPYRASQIGPRRDAEDDDWEEEETPRRPTPEEGGRDARLRQRLRAARGDEPEAEFYDDLDDIEESRPSRRYARRDVGYAPRYESGSGCGAAALYLTLGGLAVFVLLLLVGRQLIGGFTNAVPQQIRQIVATPTTTVFDRGGTIKQIQNLNRLETSRYTIERVIEASIERGNFLDNFLGDRLLLIASGTVVAGVDMSKLKDSDVIISPDGKSIKLTLPPSEVFDHTLDNQRTRVYDRQTGPLAGDNKDLETRARQEAENTIFQAACEDGILQKASDEAQRSMEQFLRLLKFQDVQVVGRAGTCAAPVQTGTPATPTP